MAASGNAAGLARAAKLEPGDALYPWRLAQLEESGSALDRVVALNPRHARAWMERGLAAEQAGDQPFAERCLLRAAKADRGYLPKWTLANYYLRRGRRAEMWRWTRAAAEALGPQDPTPLFRLAWSASDDAGEILAEAIPPIPLRRSQYRDFLLSTGRTAAAAELP